MSSRAIARSNALLAASRLLSQCTSSASKALQQGRARESRAQEQPIHMQTFDMEGAGSIPPVLFVVAVGDELLDFLLSRVLRRHPLVGVQVAQRQGRRRHQTQRPKTPRAQPYSHMPSQFFFSGCSVLAGEAAAAFNVVSWLLVCQGS